MIDYVAVLSFLLYLQIFLIKIVPSLLNGIKVAAFAWYSVKIRDFFGVRFERRKVDKKSKPTWKLKHTNSILESFDSLSAKCHQNWSL